MRPHLFSFAAIFVLLSSSYAETVIKALTHIEASAAVSSIVEGLIATEQLKPVGPEEFEALTEALVKHHHVALPKSTLRISKPTNAITLITENPLSIKVFESIIEALDRKPVTLLISALFVEVQIDEKRPFGRDCLKEIKEISVDGKVQPFAGGGNLPLAGLSAKQRAAYFTAVAASLGKLDGVNVLARPSIHARNGQRGEITIERTDATLTLGVLASLTETPNHVSMEVSFDQRKPVEADENQAKSAISTTVEFDQDSFLIFGGTVAEDDGKRCETMVLLHTQTLD